MAISLFSGLKQFALDEQMATNVWYPYYINTLAKMCAGAETILLANVYTVWIDIGHTHILVVLQDA